MASRSWVSMANATWTISPLQQEMTSPSEAHRWFDPGATTLPSYVRMTRFAVLGCSVLTLAQERGSGSA